jgi:beta-lactamase class A
MRFATSKKFFSQSVGLLLVMGLGLGLGWYLWGRPTDNQGETNNQQALRLAGYEFVSPLLVCDTSFNESTPELSDLKDAFNKVVETSSASGVVSTASVYFRDLNTGREVSINSAERFFPASLKKIPLMMKLYRDAERDTSLIQTKRVLTGSQDFNLNAAIPPSKVPVYGQEYTQDELIQYMIKYSDNISFQVLLNTLGVEKFNKVFTDLQLYYPDSVVSINDYVTPYQFSLFFRTLYNATYLNADSSEKSLKLMSETEFDEGLVAGVPKNVKVAHKFGVGVVSQQDGTDRGELHDCGITYHPKNPYLICVMTKSEASIAKVSGVIARVSAVAYKAAEADYR